MELRRKQRREHKLERLRERYLVATTQKARDKILEKVVRVARTVTVEQFLATVEQIKQRKAQEQKTQAASPEQVSN